MRVIAFPAIFLASILLLGCTSQEVVEHQTAVPVEKLVYLPIDWSKFSCPAAPVSALTKGSVNSQMKANLDQWQLLALCLQDEIDQVKALAQTH